MNSQPPNPDLNQVVYIFETSRLVVRRISSADLPGFQALQGSAEVMRFTAGLPLDPDESASLLAGIVAQYGTQENETWIWAVVTKEGEFIGTCAFFRNEEGENEIAYRLLPEYWGQGYGQETADGLIDYCLGNLNLKSITAHAAKDNLASIKILDRSLMTFVEEYEDQKTHRQERRYRCEIQV